jgi:hypothetical protein
VRCLFAHVFTLLLWTAALLPLGAQELLKNGSFAEGESKWDIEGKVEPGPGGITANLDEKKWLLIEQEIELPDEESSTVKVKIELAASPDYKPAASSKAYDSVDFGMGGSYGWTARVFPKCDFLVTVRNSGGWDYRPLKISPGGPQTFQLEFTKVKYRKNQGLTFAFPPGTGKVDIKSISAIRTQ